MRLCNSISTLAGGLSSAGRLSAAIALSVLVGCGSSYKFETAPVRGQVTLDGKPVGPCTIVFMPPQGRAASGPVKADGSFTLTTYDVEDGAIVGTHRAAIFVATGEEIESQAEKPLQIPDRYASPSTSGLVYEVQADRNNEFHVELTRNKPGNG